MARDTSLQAYSEIESDGTKTSQSMRIKRLILVNPQGLLRQEISWITKIPINAVCGRVNEMVKNKELREDGKRKNKRSNLMGYLIKPMEVLE